MVAIKTKEKTKNDEIYAWREEMEHKVKVICQDGNNFLKAVKSVQDPED